MDSSDMFGNGGYSMMFKAARPIGPSKEALEAARKYQDKQLELEREETKRRAENFRRDGKSCKYDSKIQGLR